MFKASPLVKKLIFENNLNINNIKGSGPNGRIIKRDLPIEKLNSLEMKKENIIKENRKEILPSKIRKIIAQRTSESFKEIPHFYLKIESNIDKLIELKMKINDSNIDTNISLNDLFVKALSIAQNKNKKTCSQWVNNKIIQYNNVDVSIAVALKEGLITPIVRDAYSKGILEISKEIKILVKKAKKGILLTDEYIGGTITISNLGMFGIKEFNAIINQPQSCILAIGSASVEPVILNNNLTQATILRSTLSADHRVLDGATAANLLKDFNDIIENPFEIWLESNDMKLN